MLLFVWYDLLILCTKDFCIIIIIIDYLMHTVIPNSTLYYYYAKLKSMQLINTQPSQTNHNIMIIQFN